MLLTQTHHKAHDSCKPFKPAKVYNSLQKYTKDHESMLKYVKVSESMLITYTISDFSKCNERIMFGLP